MQKISGLLGLLLLFFSLNSIAVGPPQSTPHGIVLSDIYYIEDQQRDLDVESVLALLQSTDTAEQFEEMPGQVFNQGNDESQYWLTLSIQNSSAQHHSLRLVTGVAYRLLLKVYLLDDLHTSKLILNGTATQHFTERNNDFRYLNSQPFELAPDESKRLLIQYRTHGSSYLPLSIHNAADIHDMMLNDSVNAALFYSFSMAAIVVFLLFGLAMLDKTSVLYAGLFLLGLLFIASMEGFAFKYLWPQAPQWNNLSPLILQYLLSAAGFGVAYGAALRTSINSYVHRAMLYLAVICLLLMLLSFVAPFVPMAFIASPLLGLMFIAQGYAMASWMSVGQKRNAVAIVAAILLAVFVSLMVLLSLDASLLPGYFYIYSTRIVYLVASIATMATIIAHVSGLRQDHEKALQNELLLTRREAETNKALFEAEQNYSRARQLASLRQQQLATASHDMRQPLTSLRATIDALVHDESAALKTQLRNAFDYLENLCSDYLRDTRPQAAANETPIATLEQSPAEVEHTEPYAAALILQTAGRMFEHEARTKGLQFRQQSCSVRIDRPPLVLMRIVTNLLSNAIKHTREGRVLLGARRRGDRLSIQVHDTGPGMDAQQLVLLTQAYEKGPESSGEGLGLAICRQLAEQHGMHLQIYSTPGKGTCFSIDLPIVN